MMLIKGSPEKHQGLLLMVETAHSRPGIYHRWGLYSRSFPKNVRNMAPLFQPYPEYAPSDVGIELLVRDDRLLQEQYTYDYIIVGGKYLPADISLCY